MECNVELSISVDSIVFSCIKSSNVARFPSCVMHLSESQQVMVFLQGMFVSNDGGAGNDIGSLIPKGKKTYRPFAASWYRSLSFHPSWNWNIFMGTNTFEHAEFKSEKLLLHRPAVFSQTAMLCSLISQLFSLFNDMDQWRQTIMSLKNINFN
jgi:hypothetical protein